MAAGQPEQTALEDATPTTAGGAPAVGHDVPALLRGARIFVFDGICNLCSGGVIFLARRDRARRLRFVAAQSPVGQAILRHFGLPLDTFDSYVYVDDGTPWFKSTGYIRIGRELGPPWSWLTVVRFLPLGLRDWFYDRLARNRYSLFGRRSACLIPEAGIADRFL